ncbi:hypothetical protein QJS10_CPA07g00281 [Acorus calamus]|uniref:Uncharacterized protein n=1 Tax=Acorus calamus TaxID=4465 RepID=A0AAV9EHY7_ACOCL|nr:hypothetical protein QJS10_CPA07g00281 [Acorus calamus]
MGEAMRKPRGGRRWRCSGRRSGGFLEGLLREVERKKRGWCVMREEREDGGMLNGGNHNLNSMRREFLKLKHNKNRSLQLKHYKDAWKSD